MVVFDDVHWGEPAFLDLVEHVADLSRGAPILLLCMARPELLDLRPTWGGGKLNATNVLLEPLGQEEAELLIAELDERIDPELRGRILEAAGGNPLFVEEMVAMAEDGGEIVVPPTIQALLAARLDQLEPAERGVLERGAIEGLVFHRGAVAALGPEEATVDGRLITLVRKDLVRPEPTVFVDEEAYRFRHLLIRDTAYEALPKAVRAELHDRFATWLEEHGAALVELDEIIGYHLEQAYRYRAELGPLDDAAGAIAARAAARLLRSAERARERGDIARRQGPARPGAGAASARRSVAPLDAARPGRRPRRARRLPGRDEPSVTEAAAAARAAQDERLLARCELARTEAEVQADPSATMQAALASTREQLAVLERLGDEEGAVWALRLLATFTAWLGRTDEALRLNRQALDRAERVSPRLVNDVRIWILWQTWWGPTPIDEGIRRCDEVIASSTSKRSRGDRAPDPRRPQGGSRAARRRTRRAGGGPRAAARPERHDLVGRHVDGRGRGGAGRREIPRSHTTALAEGQEELVRTAETGYLATMAGYRAQAALDLGREDEALELAAEAARLGQADDFEPHARSRLVRARVAARRGEFESAEELLREAAAIIEPTDYFIMHVDLRLAEAEVERLAGRPEREREALEKARALGEAKGCTRLALRVPTSGSPSSPRMQACAETSTRSTTTSRRRPRKRSGRPPLQYVRKISGFTKPSRANEEAFDRAVDEVAAVSQALLDRLVTNAAPRNREVEAERKRALAAKRFATAG